MGADERTQLNALRKWAETVPEFRPQGTNEPQKGAFACDADEIGYGGAATGGKSILGLLKALYQHHNTVIFRQTLPMHSGLIRKIKQWLPNQLKGNPPVLLPERKRKVIAKQIRLAYLNHEDHLDGEQGNAKDCAIFDEAVQFPREWINRIAAHIRPDSPEEFAAAGLKCQLVLTFNPPLNSVGLWVLDMFGPWIDENHKMYPVPYGEVLYCCYYRGRDFFFRENTPLTHDPIDGKELDFPIYLKSRTFFKATIKDNEEFRNNKTYIATLQSQDEKVMRAFLYGDWDASLVDALGQIFKTKPYKDCLNRWREVESSQSEPKIWPLALGFDTAHGGGDDNAFYPIWEGGYFGTKSIVKGESVPDAGKLCDWLENEILERWKCSPEFIPICYDELGGYDFGHEWTRRHPTALVYKFKGSQSAGVQGIFKSLVKPDNDNYAKPKNNWNAMGGLPWYSEGVKFRDKISAAYVRLGDATRHPEYTGIAFPPDNDLQRQLTSRLAPVDKDRVGITPKEKFIKDFGKSPNEADAAVMAYWFIDVVLKFGLSKREIERFEEIQRVRCS